MIDIFFIMLIAVAFVAGVLSLFLRFILAADLKKYDESIWRDAGEPRFVFSIINRPIDNKFDWWVLSGKYRHHPLPEEMMQIFHVFRVLCLILYSPFVIGGIVILGGLALNYFGA